MNPLTNVQLFNIFANHFKIIVRRLRKMFHKFVLTCNGPKLESGPLYIYSCNTSPQLWFKLLGKPRASTQGVKIDWPVHRKQSVFGKLGSPCNMLYISTWERCYCIGLWINIITCKSFRKAVVKLACRKEGCHVGKD